MIKMLFPILFISFAIASEIPSGAGVDGSRAITENSLSSLERNQFNEFCDSEWDLEESVDLSTGQSSNPGASGKYRTAFITTATGTTKDQALVNASRFCAEFKPNGRTISSGDGKLENNYTETVEPKLETLKNKEKGKPDIKYYISSGICCTPFVVEQR